MNQWKIKKHSYQIADTGCYDGSIEITNGNISLFCDCDIEDEELKPIIDALNNSEIEFEVDNSPTTELFYENERLKEEIKRFDSAVEVDEVTTDSDNVQDYFKIVMHSEVSPFKQIGTSKTHNLYAIPKEQEDE